MITGNRRGHRTVMLTKLILLLALPVLLGSCVLLRSNATHYYLFEYAAPGDEPGGVNQAAAKREAAIQETLIVEEPVVSPVYERRQIVQRIQGPQLIFLSNDLWVVNPSRGVQNLLVEQLRNESLFRAVEPPDRDIDAQYRLVTVIDRMEFDVRNDTPRASVSIRIALQDARTGKELVTAGGSYARELRESTPYLFAVAVNVILKEEIETLIAEIETWSVE